MKGANPNPIHAMYAPALHSICIHYPFLGRLHFQVLPGLCSKSMCPGSCGKPPLLCINFWEPSSRGLSLALNWFYPGVHCTYWCNSYSKTPPWIQC